MPPKRDLSGTMVAGVIFIAMIAGVLYRYWPSDERDILRHLSNLAEGLSISSSDNEVQRITRFAALREYFWPEVRVRFDTQEIVTRDAVIQRLEQLRPPPGGIAFELVDIKVALSPKTDSAQVQMTVNASTTDPTTRQSILDRRMMDLLMRKVDGDWVIAAAETRP